MNKRIHLKTLLIAAASLALLLLLAGAAGRSSQPQIGRFQIACTDSACYLVDTATGAVWHSGDRDFRRPKIAPVTEVGKPEKKAFVGQWRSIGDGGKVRIWLESDGTARAESPEPHEGNWRLAGDRIIITVDEDESATGYIDTLGNLVLQEEGHEDDRLSFEKVE